MMKFFFLLLVGLFVRQVFASEISLDYVHASLSGGSTTAEVVGESAQAFQQPAANLSDEDVRRHLRGDSVFGRAFSGDATMDLNGLGPVYNNTSCIACHARDGRGALPMIPIGQEWVALRQNDSVFLRISIESDRSKTPTAAQGWGAPVAVPDYSTQLFHLGNISVRPDAPGVGQARVWMKYEFSEFKYPDGLVVKLRKPLFKITDAYSPRIYQADVRISPRIGTPMIGLGLLEAIREEDILALAARDLSAEGVSGKPNYVFDIGKSLKGDPYPVSLGRFGLKANTPSVFHQALGALNGDMGVTNFAFPLESILGTALFASLPPGTIAGKVEASQEVAESLVFYSQTLAVPSRRSVTEAEVVRGAELFHQVRCTSCHQPSFTTGAHGQLPAFTNQKIYPFTDMLLHDMGPGLADGRRDFDADGQEWKTRPLWGLGHTQTINPRAGFLHDGRAKSLEEAILWHDGEGNYSRQKFVKLPAAQRAALLAFLKSL